MRLRKPSISIKNNGFQPTNSNGFNVGEDGDIAGEFLQDRSFIFIVHAEGNLREGIQHVDLRDRDRIEGIDHGDRRAGYLRADSLLRGL